jgi:hypothetical protein
MKGYKIPTTRSYNIPGTSDDIQNLSEKEASRRQSGGQDTGPTICGCNFPRNCGHLQAPTALPTKQLTACARPRADLNGVARHVYTTLSVVPAVQNALHFVNGLSEETNAGQSWPLNYKVTSEYISDIHREGEQLCGPPSHNAPLLSG